MKRLILTLTTLALAATLHAQAPADALERFHMGCTALRTALAEKNLTMMEFAAELLDTNPMHADALTLVAMDCDTLAATGLASRGEHVSFSDQYAAEALRRKDFAKFRTPERADLLRGGDGAHVAEFVLQAGGTITLRTQEMVGDCRLFVLTEQGGTVEVEIPVAGFRASGDDVQAAFCLDDVQRVDVTVRNAGEEEISFVVAHD